MGGGNSVENTVTAVNTAIQKNIVKAVNDTTQGVDLSQLMDIDCSRIYTAYNQCLATMVHADPRPPENEIHDLCGDLKCEASHVSMKQTINVTQIADQTSDIVNKINDTATQDLTSTIKAATGLGEFSDDTKNDINATSKSVQTAVSKYFSKLAQQDNIVQQIKATNGATINFVTQDQMVTYIQNSIIHDKQVTNDVDTLSQTVVAHSKNKGGLSSDMLTKVIAYGVGGLILLVFLYFVVSKLRRSKHPEAGDHAAAAATTTPTTAHAS
jgi:hypothetical protein